MIAREFVGNVRHNLSTLAANSVPVVRKLASLLTSLLADSTEENKNRVQIEFDELGLKTSDPNNPINPCDVLVPKHFVMNPYVWHMVNVSSQERTTELEHAMGLERVECLSDLHRAGAGLLFKETDHVTNGILGMGAFAVVCKAFMSTRPDLCTP